MLTTYEKKRRKDPFVCTGCGWNIVVMEYHGECGNPQCLYLGAKNSLPGIAAKVD